MKVLPANEYVIAIISTYVMVRIQYSNIAHLQKLPEITEILTKLHQDQLLIQRPLYTGIIPSHLLLSIFDVSRKHEIYEVGI